MVRLDISREEWRYPYIDRDGMAKNNGRQGFDIIISNCEIHFEDENDALELARAILERLGET